MKDAIILTLAVRSLDSQVDITMPLRGRDRFDLFCIHIVIYVIGGVQSLRVIRENTLPCIFRTSLMTGTGADKAYQSLTIATKNK